MKARIYTKTGDKGQTSLVGGTRVSKTDPRLNAYGTLDELNSLLGLIRSSIDGAGLGDEGRRADQALQTVQNNLFNIGSHLACEDGKVVPGLPRLTEAHIQALELDMDAWEKELPPLKNFILPGGSQPASFAHHARTVCRRSERDCLRLAQTVPVDEAQLIYLNRLSDWLFLLARNLNYQLKVDDIPWSK